MDSQQEALGYLIKLSVPFEIIHHPAVFTMDQVQQLGLDHQGMIVKNLFLRDAKGTRHFLITLSPEKRADLSLLQAQLGCSKLSFASEERLMKYLGLTKGSVSPLGVFHDSDHQVEVVFDRDLCGGERIGVHPNDNTATVFLSFDGLMKIMHKTGHPVTFVDILARPS